TITDGLRTITWDAEHRVSAITMSGSGATTTFTYDGTGVRVKKQQGANVIVYSGKLLECGNPPTCSQYVRYVFAGGTPIATVSSRVGSPSYIETDHLGSTRKVAVGSQAGTIDYQPFGVALADSSSVRYKFTGQEWDSETQLYNFGARLYDPSLGRFVAP